jgi:two-component system, cell cycle sensor histidine kinase and response regulator CckA
MASAPGNGPPSRRPAALVENVFELIIVLDSAGRVFECSPSVERVLGYRGPEVLTASLLDLAHPDDRPALQEVLIDAARSGGDPVPVAFRCRHQQGTWKSLQAQARAVAGGGSHSRLVLNALDVTEWKQAEAALRQALKMEAVGRLAGGVAHDFNNLLTVILGQSGRLLTGLEEGHPLQAAADAIRRSAERAESLTRQLLAFSRKQVLAPRILDLNAVVASMDRLIRSLIGDRIALVIEPGDGLGSVKADPGQLGQVLMNLAVNARDAMPDGGTLTIATGNAELKPSDTIRYIGARPGRYVVLAVSDTGAGIAPEIQGRLFEPFFTTKPQGKGTGLGLSTVYGIVKQSSGYIWVDSEPGRGASFRVYLPRLDEVPEPLRAGVRAEPVQRGSELILLVEDEDDLRDLLRERLEQQGYALVAASNGQEALALAERENRPIDLLVTDMVMPGMSGPDLARRLTSGRGALKVLYLSGYTDERDLALEPDAGFLQKPFTMDALARKVRQVIDGP